MGHTLRVLGLDPGFASIGYACIAWIPSTGARYIDDFGVFETELSPRKRRVLAVEDNVRRAREIAKFLRWAITHRHPMPCVLGCEAMSFPRSSSVAAKMAMAWGCIVSASEASGIPILQATPMAIKQTATGARTATKEEVIEACARLYPEVVRWRDPIAPFKWEHCHDALATAHMMLSSEVVLAAGKAVA